MESTKKTREKTLFTRIDEYDDRVPRWGNIIIFSILAIFAIIVFFNSYCVIGTGETGILTTFGHVEPGTLQAGVHWKLPYQHVIKMNNRVQKASETLQCFSKDIQEVNVLYTVNYRISATNASEIYKTIGTEYYSTIVVPNILECVKEEAARYTAEELVSSREKLAMNVQESLSIKLADYNIELVATSIEDLDFTDAFTNAVEAKQVAQQNKLKAQTEAEQKIVEANADAEKRKIEADANAYEIEKQAEAQAKANEMLANSLTRGVLTYKFYEKWNGVLPSVTAGNDLSMILPQTMFTE